ncbi:MAG: DUF4430 domain-containing protein, partial [Butyribacter sp.]|nr:DUF4430 domain-containing protein [bacterium]MDY3853843.1 DUF4430 domain-containing protein [Butyribacter sp.]
NTWGSDAEVEEMAGKIALLKEYFTDKKIPVLVGEFGTGLDNDTKSRIKFCKELTRRCKKIGIPVFFWDNGGEFDRENLTWRTKGLAEAMLKAATKEKLVVYVAAEGKNDSGATVSIDKTPVLVEEGTMASDAVKTVLDSAYPDDYVMKQETWGDFLQSIGKLDTPSDYSYSWNFCVNGEMASVGINSYELQAQDQISLIYGGYPLENTECSVYADDEMLSPDAEAQKALLDNAEAQQKVLAEKIYEAQFESGKRIPGIEDASGLYSVFSLAQSNFDADAFYDAVYEKISKQLEGIQKYGKFYDETLGKEITEKSIKTDRSLGKNAVSQYYAKIALCVLALGKNPADVGGVNLYQKMLERSAYDASSVYSRESMILFVLDAKVCELPEGENYVTKGELVNNLLADVDNQIATAISWTSYDSAAMAIQALAPYLTETVDGVSKEEVENACQKVLHLLSVMQNGTGGYPGYGTDNNAWSLAQAMTTMGCFGISALEETETEAGFINNGKTVFDAASAFVDSSKQTVSEELMGFQPEQLLRGLNACIRTALGEETIYQTENVAYPANESDKIVLSPEMISAIPAQTYEGKACEPAVVVTCDGKVLKAGTDYTVSYIDNDKEGTAYAIVTGTGDYVLSQQVAFQIVKKAVVNQNNTNNNGNKNQSITKKESTKKKTLKKPVIKKLTSPKKKTLKVTFKKVSGAKKYVVEISTNKKFKKSVKKKTVKKTTVTFSKLKAKKKYYVRVRAYNGNVKSGYSTVKSKKIK